MLVPGTPVPGTQGSGTLRVSNAGQEENPINNQLKQSLSGEDQSIVTEPLQAELPFENEVAVWPDITTKVTLKNGLQLPLHFGQKKSSKNHVVLPQPLNAITFRQRSLAPGAVWEYTLYKLLKILDKKRLGDEGYERNIGSSAKGEAVYLFSVSTIEQLINDPLSLPPESVFELEQAGLISPENAQKWRQGQISNEQLLAGSASPLKAVRALAKQLTPDRLKQSVDVVLSSWEKTVTNLDGEHPAWILIQSREPSSEFLIDTRNEVVSGGLEEDRITDELTADETIQPARARGERIIRSRFRAAATTAKALDRYRPYEETVIKPRFEGILSSAALEGIRETVLNMMEHGGGGDLEIFMAPASADGISQLTVRVADQGPGLIQPNDLLERSIDQHAGIRRDAGDYRGYGLKNIADPAVEMTVESGRVKWRLTRADGNFRFEWEGPTDVDEGTVITVVYESKPAAGQEENGAALLEMRNGNPYGPIDPVDAVNRLVDALITQGYKGEQQLTFDRTSTLLDRKPTQQALSLNSALVAEMNRLLKIVARKREPGKALALLKPAWEEFQASELTAVVIQKGAAPVRIDPVDLAVQLVDALIAKEAEGKQQLGFKTSARLLNKLSIQTSFSRNPTLVTRINELLVMVAAEQRPSESALIPAWEKFRKSKMTEVVIAKEIRSAVPVSAGQEESIWDDVSREFGISKELLLERLSERDRNQLRRATNITAPKMIALYARIFGVSISAEQQQRLTQTIVSQRIVTQTPAPPLVQQAYAYLAQSGSDTDIYLRVQGVAQAVQETLRNDSLTDREIKSLETMIQPADYSPEQETLLQKTARWMVETLEPESGDTAQIVSSLRAITSSHSIERIAQVVRAYEAFSLNQPWRLNALTMSAIHPTGLFLPARFSDSRVEPLLVVVDSDRGYPLPRFAGEAAHEYAHALLGRRPFWKEQVTGTSMADWITQAVELLTADRIALENNENPEPYLSILYREGERLALEGSSLEWEPVLRELDQYPDSKRWYLQGVFIGGLAKGLGKRVADQTARSAEPFAAHELGLRFISSLTDAIAESGGRSPIEVLIKTAQNFPNLVSAGQEERQVLRFYPDQGGAKMVAEQGPDWTPLPPVTPQRLILPNDPDWRLSVDEGQLRQLAQFLFQQFQDNIARGYPLQMGDRKITEATRSVYPVSGLEPYEGILDYDKFRDLVDLLHRELFLPAGSSIDFAALGRIASYSTLELPWQEVSYLGGRTSTWLASAKLQINKGAPGSFIYGSTWRNLSLYDPETARQAAEFQHQKFLSDGKTRGIPAAALQSVQQLHDADPAAYQDLFVEAAKQEEINHARDFTWAAYFYQAIVDFKGVTHPFVAEAVIRPDSFLDRTVWNPAKRGNSDLVVSARNIVELSGQTQVLADTLRALRNSKGEAWAYGYFWVYLFQKTEERLHQPGTVSAGHDQSAAALVFDSLKEEGFTDLQQLEAHLRAVPDTHGSRALEVAERFHDENFLTEPDRIAILERSERGEQVSLGVRQSAAGQEENAIQAITADEIRARFVDIPVRDGETGYLVQASALTQVNLYAHQSLSTVLNRMMDRQSKLFPNIQVKLKKLPSTPTGLQTLGVVIWDIVLNRPYEQTLLPELELDIHDDSPDLPALVLFALQGPGAELKTGISLYKIKDAQAGNEYYLFV